MGVMSTPIGTLIDGRVVDVAPTTTLRQASVVLSEEHVGLLIVDDPASLRGVVSERDIALGVAEGLDVDEARVSEVMSDDVVTLPPAASLLEALQTMRANEIRHIVIQDVDEIVGVVSIRTVLEAALDPLLVKEAPALA